jgi:hypothetical protein
MRNLQEAARVGRGLRIAREKAAGELGNYLCVLRFQKVPHGEGSRSHWLVGASFGPRWASRVPAWDGLAFFIYGPPNRIFFTESFKNIRNLKDILKIYHISKKNFNHHC